MDDHKADITELARMHELVKLHPYRLTGQDAYLKDYRDKLRELVYAFGSAVYKDKKWKGAAELVHDLVGAIDRIGAERNKYIGSQYDGWTVLLVEQNLGVIHYYIDYGTVPQFYSFYAGTNTLKSVPRHCRHVYYEQHGKYYPVYTNEQIDAALTEIEKSYTDRPRPRDQYMIYSDLYRDWLLKIRSNNG